jgi:hypothetical protein
VLQSSGIKDEGAPLDLVDGGDDPRGGDQLIDLRRAVVADPNSAREALLSELRESLPSGHAGAVRGPVHEPQINIISAERVEAAFQSAALRSGLPGRQLGGDEDLVSWQPGFVKCNSQLSFVAVDGCGIEVAVAGLKRPSDGVARATAAQAPCAQSYDRHCDVAGKFDGGLRHGTPAYPSDRAGPAWGRMQLAHSVISLQLVGFLPKTLVVRSPDDRAACV